MIFMPVIVLNSMSCTHVEVRCVHGDEITHRSGRTTIRAACARCGASVNGPLPRVCTVTGEPHGE